MEDMQELGRTIALAGGVAFLLGVICQLILVAGFYAEKANDGYVAYVTYMFKHPGAFFTYVFKELEPGDWRKKLVIPWFVLSLGGIALVVTGAALDPSS